MPKLILFAPCEKIVVDQTDNTTSLINLLEAIQVAVPDSEKESLQPDTSVLVNWSLLALWQIDPSDGDRVFESHFSIIFASGEEITLNTTPLPLKFETGKPNFRNILRVLGLPLNPLVNANTCTVRASIREQGMDDWEAVREFPIIVRQPPSEVA